MTTPPLRSTSHAASIDGVCAGRMCIGARGTLAWYVEDEVSRRGGISCYTVHVVRCRGGEMADASALGADGIYPMEVQVLSPAPLDITRLITSSDLQMLPDKHRYSSILAK